jgi:hypothetical protein
MAVDTGWLGHTDIPQPARVRREYPQPHIDWLDCLLAIWIAEAMLEAGPEECQEEASEASANPLSILRPLSQLHTFRHP